MHRGDDERSPVYVHVASFYFLCVQFAEYFFRGFELLSGSGVYANKIYATNLHVFSLFSLDTKRITRYFKFLIFRAKLALVITSALFF